MAQEEVKIFFKVDGLDDYITDLDELKVALGNVDEETQAAARATKKLEDATADALAEEERRLDVLEGGVKVLAGSAEFAAGAFALLGDEGNEFFENVEANVLGTIALGQGVIDVTEGYRLLKTNLDLSATAQKAFNLVAKANPYVILAGALIAAAGAFLLFKTRAAEAQKQVDEARKAFEELSATTRESAEADIAAVEEKERLAEVSETVAELSKKELQDKIALQKAEQDAAQEAIRLKKEELQAALDANAIIGTGFKSIGFVEKAQEELDAAQAAYNTTLATTNTELAIYNGELDKRIEKENLIAAPDGTSGTLDRIETKTIDSGVATAELITNTGLAVTQTEEQVAGFSVDQADRITNFTDVSEETLTNFAGVSADVFGALGDLNQVLTKDDEKREKKAFEIQKKAQLAQAIIVGALAINKAFASQIIPGDPTSLPRAIAAGALASLQTAAQIAVISRQQFESPQAGGGGGTSAAGSINYNLGDQQAGGTVTGPGTTGGGGTGGATQTYVLAGDVTSQQEAEAQIINLARL